MKYIKVILIIIFLFLILVLLNSITTTPSKFSFNDTDDLIQKLTKYELDKTGNEVPLGIGISKENEVQIENHYIGNNSSLEVKLDTEEDLVVLLHQIGVVSYEWVLVEVSSIQYERHKIRVSQFTFKDGDTKDMMMFYIPSCNKGELVFRFQSMNNPEVSKMEFKIKVK